MCPLKVEQTRFIETPEQERERLAQAPVGSRSHFLSTIPVKISFALIKDLVIALPLEAGSSGATASRIVVVPIRFREDLATHTESPRRRHSGSWECAVIASDHPSYPVGGYRLSVSTEELVRGTQINLAKLLRITSAA